MNSRNAVVPPPGDWLTPDYVRERNRIVNAVQAFQRGERVARCTHCGNWVHALREACDACGTATHQAKKE